MRCNLYGDCSALTLYTSTVRRGSSCPPVRPVILPEDPLRPGRPRTDAGAPWTRTCKKVAQRRTGCALTSRPRASSAPPARTATPSRQQQAPAAVLTSRSFPGERWPLLLRLLPRPRPRPRFLRLMMMQHQHQQLQPRRPRPRPPSSAPAACLPSQVPSASSSSSSPCASTPPSRCRPGHQHRFASGRGCTSFSRTSPPSGATSASTRRV